MKELEKISPAVNTITIVSTAAKRRMINFSICNSGTATDTIDIWIAPFGDTVTDADKVFANLPLVEGERITETSGQLIDVGETLWVRSTLGTANFRFSSKEDL